MTNNTSNPVTGNGAGADSKSQAKKMWKSAFLILFSVCALVVIAFAIRLLLAILNVV